MSLKPMRSYELVPDHMKEIYMQFYKATYREGTVLDNKTKELIAVATSLAVGAQGCIEGHLKKAVSLGCTKDEIGEAVVIAMGINAAAIVDKTDIANFNIDLNALIQKAGDDTLKINSGKEHDVDTAVPTHSDEIPA